METINDQVERPQWLDHEIYPFTLRSIDLAKGPVTYIDEGEGPVLLFVHAGMWSFVFRDVVSLLIPHYRCVTLDFPGSGLTPPGDGQTALVDNAHLVAEFVETLGLHDVTLVGHDLGGLVGLGAVGRDRHRYVGLVMANSFAWTPDTRGLRAMLRVMGSPVMTAVDYVFNLVPRMSSTSFGVGRHYTKTERRAFLGPFRDRGPRRRFHHLMRSVLADRGYTEEVDQMTKGALNDLPVLSIYGERNDPFGFQDRVAATWPDHEGHVFERGNHFPMCDDPARFAELVTDWHMRKVV